jgi:hypothetical protein
MVLRKHWASSTSLDSGFKSDPWQLRGDEIFESFERDVMGTDDSRKFETGFPGIDNSGMNIGLDGEHAIVLYVGRSRARTQENAGKRDWESHCGYQHHSATYKPSMPGKGEMFQPNSALVGRFGPVSLFEVVQAPVILFEVV